MVTRLAALPLRQRLREYAAVALVGPRQAGKTTLARRIGGQYFDLEQPEDRLRLDLLWAQLLPSRRLVVLDEAQVWPEVFPRLRAAIDAHPRRCGRFLLLGSIAPGLMKAVSESLAGRLALCELTPLLALELPPETDDRLWLRGGYPKGGVLAERRYPTWQQNYLALLAQRDLPLWGLSATPQLTQRLFRILAHAHSDVWNASDMGRSLGLSYQTVNTYVDYLEHAFLVRRLPAFHGNVRKRLIKSPRLYWRDSGLLHALLGVPDWDGLLVHPKVGASYEGWVIEQILATHATIGRPIHAYYFRTSDGHEIDLVLEEGRRRWAIEIKLTSSPSPEDFRRLNTNADLIDAQHRMLICRITQPVHAGKLVCTHLRDALAYFVERVTRVT